MIKNVQPLGEIACEPGQAEYPALCNRHREHHWCDTCQGFYGVPHDGMHEGPNAHPYQSGYTYRECACRPCKNKAAERERA